MLKCLFIKRRMYDYFDGGLSESGKIKIKNHLDACPSCRQQFNQIKSIAKLASEKKAPEPGQEFWHNFRIDLDSKLNAKLLTQSKVNLKPFFRLNPALVYAASFIFVLGLAGYFYIKPYSRARSAQDDRFVEEVLLLDELDEGPELNHSEESYLEQLDTLYYLDQS